MTTLPFRHLGAWTMRKPAVTDDELHNDVIAIAQRYADFPLIGAEQARLEDYRRELYEAPVLGTGHIRDAAQAGDLAYMARRALDWLNEHAPADRRLMLGDALYMIDTADETVP